MILLYSINKILKWEPVANQKMFKILLQRTKSWKCNRLNPKTISSLENKMWLQSIPGSLVTFINLAKLLDKVPLAKLGNVILWTAIQNERLS